MHRSVRGESREGGSGATPDFDPLHSAAPKRYRKCRRGGSRGQHVVDDRDPSRGGWPPADAERARDIGISFPHASGSCLRWRVAANDASFPGRFQVELASDDGCQLLGVVESANEQALAGKRHPEHRVGHAVAGPDCELPRKELPERRRPGEVPGVLHAVDETAQRGREVPRCDDSIVRRRIADAGRAEKGHRSGLRRRSVRRVDVQRCRATRTRPPNQERRERSLAVSARVVRSADFPTKAACPREKPLEQCPGWAVNPRSLQHQTLSGAPAGSPPPPVRYQARQIPIGCPRSARRRGRRDGPRPTRPPHAHSSARDSQLPRPALPGSPRVASVPATTASEWSYPGRLAFAMGSGGTRAPGRHDR